MFMFCSNCGAQNANGSRFCRSCGSSIQAPPAAPASPQIYQPAPENVIDLRGTRNHGPAEKVDKGAVVAAILMVLGWIVFALLGGALVKSAGVKSDDSLWQKLLVVVAICLPVFILGYSVARYFRSKVDLPPLEKGPAFVTNGYCWLLTAAFTALAFRDIFIPAGLGDLVKIVLIFFTAVFALVFVIFAASASSQYGAAIRYKLFTAYFFSFLPGALLGCLLAALIAAAGLLIVIGIVLLVFFFANGGIILYRREN